MAYAFPALATAPNIKARPTNAAVIITKVAIRGNIAASSITLAAATAIDPEASPVLETAVDAEAAFSTFFAVELARDAAIANFSACNILRIKPVLFLKLLVETPTPLFKLPNIPVKLIAPD